MIWLRGLSPRHWRDGPPHSVNLLRFMFRLLHGDGLYSKMEEVQGLRSSFLKHRQHLF